MEEQAIHSEYNAAAQYQSRQPWYGSRPEGEHALPLKDLSSAREAVLVVLASFDRLNPAPWLENAWNSPNGFLPCLYYIQRLSRISACVSCVVDPTSMLNAYTVITPAMPPSANVLMVPSFSPGAT